MYLRAVGRRLTQMIAYFLVMNSKRRITKRNKLIRFADKSPTGWTGVEEYESDELAEDSEDKKRLIQQKDGHWPRSARRSVGIRLPDLAIQVPVSHRVKLLLFVLPILFLLISSFFVGSPFASVDLNLRTSASVADREVIGQIQLPAPAALEEPLQSLQAARPQTDDKYNVEL